MPFKPFTSSKSSGKGGWTESKDKAADKKAGIAEGSKKDNALDRKRGLPIDKPGAGNASKRKRR